jgi:hypothetical protein
MRPIPVILALSLAANAGFALAWYFNRASDSALLEDMPVRTHADAPGAKAPVSSPEPAPDAGFLSGALKARDLKTFYEQLRALGIDEAMARNFVKQLAWQNHNARRRELLAGKPDIEKPYWRGTGKTSAQLTAAERAELRELASQARREEAAVFGAAIFINNQPAAARYRFLPEEKIARLLDLQRDYGEMRKELSDESARFKVASDGDSQRLLREEYRRELAAMLSPEELAAYDRRFSDAAAMVQRNTGNIEINEAEYSALFDVVKLVEAQWPTREMLSLPDAQRDARLRAYRDIAPEIREILGEERYAEYERMQNSDYRKLQAAADRFGISGETVDNVYHLRDTAGAESQRIAADKSLSLEEKKRALGELGAQIKEQVRAQLGDEVAAAYLKDNMRWVEHISTGAAVKFSLAGWQFKYVDPKTPNAVPRKRAK